jgi:DNA topoisomerase-3
MKCLIIAEKPSVAADLARALGKIPKKTDHYENDEYVISSAVGHLVGLQMPEDIDKKKYGFWRLETLPIIPDEFQLQPLPEGKDRFGQLKKLLARKDVTSVINACDAGREGELIFTYLYQLTKCKKPFKRLWMSDDDQRGHHRGLQAPPQRRADAGPGRRRPLPQRERLAHRHQRHPRPDQAHVRLPRRQRRLRRPRPDPHPRHRLQPRAGDPQFQAPRLLAPHGEVRDRQGRIRGQLPAPNFKKNDDEHDRIDRIWDKAKAEAILAACAGQPVASVTEEKKASTSAPPRLYDLTTLQREANSRFGFPAKRTLQIAQALYERHKMITYPRTDSRALPEDYIPLVRQTLGNLHGDLKQHAERVLESGWVQPNKRIFNNAQVSDHFAIIPTQHEAKNLDEAEAKLFDMIARRFVATFHPVAEFDITTRISTVATHAFKTEGKVLTAPGWLAVYGKTTDDESADAKALPALAPEDKSKARTLEAKLHEESTRRRRATRRRRCSPPWKAPASSSTTKNSPKR